MVGRALSDPRNPELIEHPLAELLRTELLLLAQGWEGLADADPLRHDPVINVARSDERGLAAEDKGLALQPTLSRLLGILTRPDN